MRSMHLFCIHIILAMIGGSLVGSSTNSQALENTHANGLSIGSYLTRVKDRRLSLRYNGPLAM